MTSNRDIIMTGNRPLNQGLVLDLRMNEGTGEIIHDFSTKDYHCDGKPDYVSVTSCESLTNFTGTVLSLDSDRKEGNYSVKDVVAVPVGGTEYKLTYNPAGVWNWRSRYQLRYWLKCDRASGAFTHARLYIYDSDGHYRYWDLTFDADEWVFPWSFMSYLINNELGGKDNSDGGSAAMVSDCELTTNWSTDLVSGSVTAPKTTKQGTYMIRGYTAGANVAVDTEYYLRYTLPSTQDWSGNSYLHFFFGSCIPSAEYNYIRFYIYDTDGDWAYWELSKLYAQLRGMVIDLSNPDVEAGGGLDLTKVEYIQWIVSRSVITRNYQEMRVDWVRLDDLHTEKIDKLEWNFKAADATAFTRRLDAVKLNGGPLSVTGRYGSARKLDGMGYIYARDTNPLLDGNDLTLGIWFKPDVTDTGWNSWLLYKRLALATRLYNDDLYGLCYDQVGGKGLLISSVGWANKWYLAIVKIQQESIADAHDGVMQVKLYDETSLIGSNSRSDFGTVSQCDANRVQIGRQYWGCFNNSYFVGLVDRTIIYYDRVLSDIEELTLWKSRGYI